MYVFDKKLNSKILKIKSRTFKIRQHINNNKIIYSVYFMCDMFQYKFNLDGGLFIQRRQSVSEQKRS